MHTKIDSANRNKHKLDIAEIPDPWHVLEVASKHSTFQSRLMYNPYLRAAISGYDYVRFEHKLIPILELMLIGLALQRRSVGKKMSVEFLKQEALRFSRILKETGIPKEYVAYLRG